MLPYVSRDVATEPPTTVVFVRAGTVPPETVTAADATAFALSEEFVEPTEGWLQREGKPTLTICFMHSFGKCTGRVAGNPFTCFQIHVNRAVLQALRRQYINPVRRFLSRTVKVLLPMEMRLTLCEMAAKQLRVQYLEYRVHDVSPTRGLVEYETEYRNWLFSDATRATDPCAINATQCLSFAFNGTCPKGEECEEIHAPPRCANARDPALSDALRQIGDTLLIPRRPQVE